MRRLIIEEDIRSYMNIPLKYKEKPKINEIEILEELGNVLFYLLLPAERFKFDPLWLLKERFRFNPLKLFIRFFSFIYIELNKL